jgi:hypothetical protein
MRYILPILSQEKGRYLSSYQFMPVKRCLVCKSYGKSKYNVALFFHGDPTLYPLTTRIYHHLMSFKDTWL